MRQNCKLPWINTNVRCLIRRRTRARVKAKKTEKRLIGTDLKKLDKPLKTEIGEAQIQYLTEMFTGDANGLNKKGWSYIKSRRRDNVGIPPPCHGNGRSQRNNTTRFSQRIISKYQHLNLYTVSEECLKSQ